MAYGTRDSQAGAASPAASLQQRMEALADYRILDTEAERGFEDIVFLAKNMCQTPVALISLVDRDRQWFKARIGFEACETSIDQSVCQYGLASRELLVIPDLTRDPRTRDNALVVEDPKIRFYAGAPLITPDGIAIGMVCVIDTQPRPQGLDEYQERALSALAGQVVSQLELRKTLIEQREALAHEREESDMLRRTMARLQMAEEAGEVGAFEVDFASRTLTVSREFCRIHGVEPGTTIAIDELVSKVRGTAEIDAMIARNPDFSHGEFRIYRANDDSERWIDVRSRSVRNNAGKPVGATGVVTDVTEQRAINEEISHRLKNTMALVQAIAGHTLRGVADPEPVREFNRRVSALATAHDILLSRTRAAACLHEVASGVLERIAAEDRVEQRGKDTELNSRSVLVLSMLLHELGTNALKYGSLSVPEGTVELESAIETREDGEWLNLTWRERGGPEVREPETIGLGTRLLQRGLAPDGETQLRYDPEGFSVSINSPLKQISA